MKRKFCLFAGTTEGRELADFLRNEADLTVCVATEYGEILLEDMENITVHTGRLDAEGMKALFTDGGFDGVLDATHPYAVAVTENIRQAAEETALPYLRILREGEQSDVQAVYVSSAAEAREFLQQTDGNILITTGSKELPVYVGLDMNRVWARVLPLASSLQSCAEAGIPPAHIIAAQGPFTEEMNIAQLHMMHARYMLTKASGKNGGFDDKMQAAEKAGVIPVVIGQPPQTDGYTMAEALEKLGFSAAVPVSVAVIGIGTGAEGLLTVEARETIQQADTVIGAKSVTEALGTLCAGKTVHHAYLPDQIREVLTSHPDIRRAAVVMRGDTGFYSGAKKLLAALGDYPVTLLPGISSIAYFAAALGTSWDDAALISLHGRGGNLVQAVQQHRKIISLSGGDNTVSALCERLCAYQYGHVRVTVGERLSYPDERITRGTAAELAQQTFDPLSVLLIENDDARACIRHGIPDEAFIRGDTPMTKAEVRSISLSKLALDAESVVYDIGAGSGSVSVECALAAHRGQVYAIEKDHDAVELIRQNQVKFGCDNITVIEGRAPDAMQDLPAPTHAFIGGSAGNLREILTMLLDKNPAIRVVINTVTLETQAEALDCLRSFGFAEEEILSVQVSRARRAGRYHLMTAQNPVHILTFGGGASHA